MNIPLGGLTVNTQRLKEKPDEIVKMIKAVLRANDYIRTHKAEIVSYMEAKWGIKDAEVRDSIYRDISVLYSRTGIAPDETMKNVVQLVRDTRKSKDDVPMSDIVDWSFAKRAQAELKMK
jgi:ABC-type nitrate/sulfonate/bicarbonate transport system substrate-binding protein